MLYHVYEMQRATLAPMRLMATSALAFLDLPFNGVRQTPLGRVAAAALDSFEHTTRHFSKPAFGHASTNVGGVDYPIEEVVALSLPWADLKHFRRVGLQAEQPKILIVAPMSGHYATLLRGTVKEFLPSHEVYITDWRDARDMPLMGPGFDLDDYIDYVMNFARHLGPDIHVLAVCQPAVPVLAAVALMNESEIEAAPASMTLIGGPIDTREAPTAVNKFAEKHSMEWFESRVIHRVPFGHMGFMRPVYPGFLQLAGFLAMNMERHVDAHWDMFQHLVQGDGEPLASKRAFYDEYRSVMDMSAEFYLQTIRAVFKEWRLPRGLLTHRGHKVDPSAITRTALQTIEGERDDISGLGQTKAAHALMPYLAEAKRDHLEQQGVGHYGLFNGRRFRTEVAPRIKAFAASHAAAAAAAPALLSFAAAAND